MAALGATMAALMLLLGLGSLCSCMFCAPAQRAGDAEERSGQPPNRVPTRLRLQLKPTPYERLGALGAAGDYFKRKVTDTLKQVQLIRLAGEGDGGAGAAPAQPPPGDCRQHSRVASRGAGGSRAAAAGLPLQQQQDEEEQEQDVEGCNNNSSNSSSAAAKAASPPLPPATAAGSSLPRHQGQPPPAAGSPGIDLTATSDSAAPTAAAPLACAGSSGGCRRSDDGSPRPADPTPGSCAICLVDFEPADVTIVLPCGHIYHHACGVSWLLRSRLCPHCRADVVAGLFALEPAAGG